MKNKLQIAGFCYVAFALLTAYFSVASPETMASGRTNKGIYADKVERVVRDNQRLDGLRGDGIGPYDTDNLPEPEPSHDPADKPRNVKADYTVIAWTASWCQPCRRWKAKELPALLKAGIKVKVLDYDKDKPPKEIKSVPTIILMYDGEELNRETNWKAKDILKYIDNRMALKKETLTSEGHK